MSTKLSCKGSAHRTDGGWWEPRPGLLQVLVSEIKSVKPPSIAQLSISRNLSNAVWRITNQSTLIHVNSTPGVLVHPHVHAVVIDVPLVFSFALYCAQPGLRFGTQLGWIVKHQHVKPQHPTAHTKSCTLCRSQPSDDPRRLIPSVLWEAIRPKAGQSNTHLTGPVLPAQYIEVIKSHCTSVSPEYDLLMTFPLLPARPLFHLAKARDEIFPLEATLDMFWQKTLNET